MKRTACLAALLGLALALGFGAGMNAAGKAYQFTGTVIGGPSFYAWRIIGGRSIAL